MDIELAATDRFRDSLRRFRDPNRVRARIEHILKLRISDPKNWLRDFERIHTHVPLVYREKISKGGRLLFQVDQRLTFLDFDNHDIYRDWENNLSGRTVEQMISAAAPLSIDDPRLFPRYVRKEPFSTLSTSTASNLEILVETEAEWDESWLLHLTNPQIKTVDALEKELLEHKELQIHWVVGGAGTGKTVVALHLLQRLRGSLLGLSFDTPDRARKYIEKGNKILSGIANDPQVDGVHLIDDPINSEYLAESVKLAKKSYVRAIVVFIDVLQTVRPKDSLRFVKQIKEAEKTGGKVWDLNEVFRQGEHIGTALRDLVANTFDYPMYRDSNEFNIYTEAGLFGVFADILDFSKPGGIFEVLDGDPYETLDEVADRIRQRYDLWDWSPPLLVVWDEVSYQKHKSYREYFKSIPRIDVKFGDSDAIRGTEFQEVVILMGRDNYLQLWEQLVSDQENSWHIHAPLYVFMSRAKDAVSIVLF